MEGDDSYDAPFQRETNIYDEPKEMARSNPGYTELDISALESNDGTDYSNYQSLWKRELGSAVHTDENAGPYEP